MPCYNSQETIIEAIECVYNQTFKDFMFVVCDDCSTDNTYSILLKNKENFNYLLFRNEKNLGTGLTVNRMINEMCVNNELITWVSSDNILDENFLEKHVAKIEEGYAITYSGWATFGDKSVNKQNPNEDLLHLKKTFDLGPSFLFRKKLWDKTNGFHRLPGEDYYFAVDCALNNAKFGYVNYELMKYREHDNSVSGRLRRKEIIDICSYESKENAKKINTKNGTNSYI